MPDFHQTLNDLIASCRDSEEGFGKAAKGTRDDNLRNRFMGIAQQRANFADELTREVRAAGGEPAISGHLSGIQHRGWRELETSIRPKNDTQFIEECTTGEENTLRHYEHALTLDLPESMRSLIERQHLTVQETILQLRNLEALRSV